MARARAAGTPGGVRVKWLLALVAVAAVVAANIALLSYGGGARHDPVGKLMPIASVPAPAPHPHAELEDD
jgi:hypothetical protein